ncbi:MAG: hypothetical protein ACI86H_000869 [bacterium]|jgi:hypothetical protein
MKVFVISMRGKPLMPTSPRKTRVLLKKGRAKVHSRTPFCIQLNQHSTEYVQDLTLGLDPGAKEIGYSVITEKKEIISGELKLLGGISERLKERGSYRRNRRSGLRFRKEQFSNRKREDKALAPSAKHKIEAHFKLIERIFEILPIKTLVLEKANFDMAKINNPNIAGALYQQGNLLGYENLKMYVRARDKHQCQCSGCSNKAKEKILQVHHIGFWKKDRTNRVSNLLTVCSKCHSPANHQPSGKLFGLKPVQKKLNSATIMNVVVKRIIERFDPEITFGYVTKLSRLELGLDKTHKNDAFVIAGGFFQVRAESTDFEQIRRHRRSLEKFYDAKYLDLRTGQKVSGKETFCGRTKRNKNLSGENLHVYRGHKTSKGRRSIQRQQYLIKSGDIVSYQGQKQIASGIQNSGKYLKMKGLKKVAKISDVIVLQHRAGLCLV